MQQSPGINAHKRADSVISSDSSDTTQLSDDEDQQDQAQTPNYAEPEQSAASPRDYWPSYDNVGEPLLISGRGRANPTSSPTTGSFHEERRALDLTLKARKVIRDQVRQREQWWQRTRTQNLDLCDAEEKIEERRGVWMVVTPDDVRAPFGDKEVYDTEYGTGVTNERGLSW